MTSAQAPWRVELERDGFTVLEGVFPAEEVEAVRDGLAQALARGEGRDGAIRGAGGGVYAARNVLRLWPEAARVWRRPPLPDALAEALGPSFGLVRVLYFDKPPEQTWALPWHKDLTIAVREHRPSDRFLLPTTKAGVPHVEAPAEVLEAMLTARVHLDDATEENGPLKVIPGSHRTGKDLRLGDVPPRSVHARAGDVLLIRPLVAHCSNRSHPGTSRRRRVLHLEFAASSDLPEGFAWQDFVQGAR